MAIVYLSLGSNLVNRFQFLRQASGEIEKSKNMRIKKSSSIYETQPVSSQNQNWFLNQVIEIQTSFDPGTLLECLLSIENQLGRIRGVKEISRKIDIDVLLYDDRIIETDRLIIPHPRMHLRKFVLVPLSEIASEAYHPVLKKTAKKLLEICTDNSEVRLYSEKT